jgi:hypothetical protein
MQRAGVAALLCLGALRAAGGSNVSLVALHAQTPGSTSPISRIVELLQGLHEKCELDAKTDEKLYEKFVCWGRQVIIQKTASNKIASTEIAELTQYIADLDAGRIELTTERVDLEKEIAELLSGIEVATAQRQKEKSDFEIAEEEMTQAIEALTKALGVLKTATAGHETGVLAEITVEAGHRAEHEAKETSVLKHAVELGDRFLGKGDALFLRRLLTGEVPTWDWKDLNRKATFKMSYKARSFKIQDVLANLLETFETNKADAIAKENAAQAAYDELMKSENAQLDAAREALVKMEKENGAKSLSRTDAQERVDLLTEQVASDEKYIAQVQAELAEKKSEWEERSRIRYGEIEAISKAIEILHNDGARDLFKKSLSSQGYLFLQTGQRSNPHDAAQLLRSVARTSRDKRVLALLTQVQLAPAFGSLAERFEPIIEKIDELVKLLEEEEAADLAKKESCESSRAENTREAIKLSREIDDDTDIMTRLTSEIEKLDEQIKENQDAIEVLKTQMAEALQQRLDENKAYKADKADDQMAAETVQDAYNVLETFYKEEGLMLVQKKSRAPVVVEAGKAPPPPPTTWDSPYAGKTGESAGILAILSMIKEDIERDAAKADAAESAALTAYNKLVKALEDEESARSQDILLMEADKAHKIGEHGDTEASRASTKSGLDGVLASIVGLEPSCNYFTINFPVRVKNRQIERDGLEKAKAILQGAEFGKPEAEAPKPKKKKRKQGPRWAVR